ncbi:MAG: F0F1 ATP synthase subunit A [Ruminococcus sp.]|nr:F0F1 ATP synthase subunit A [Ruminococcus sp.]
MLNEKRKFLVIDVLLIAMMVVPLVFAMVLKVLTTPESDGVNITGALIYFTIDMPFNTSLPITETQVNSWLVIISITGLCLYLTHGIKEKADTKRQLAAEWIVEKCDGLVGENMDKFFSNFAPFIAAVLGLSAFSSLMSLLGLFAPTSDINTTAGWAILVFILITYYKFKCGLPHYLKSFGEPVKLLAPINIISEFATPVSMAFRHYGNVLSGSVISVLVAAGLQGLSSMILGKIPGFLGDFPLLQIGIPAVLSIYFDVFSGCLQAYIFAMLTMMYVSDGFPAEDYEKRRNKQRKAA